MTAEFNNSIKEKPVWQRIRSWLAGLILLSGLILIVSHFSELEHFVQLVRQAQPVWLIIALLLQTATYMSVAAVWYIALTHSGFQYSFLSLVPLGIAKLFSDQAMPSGGMSGTAFFIASLNRRGISSDLCMATLLLSLVAYYGAYLVVAFATVMLLYLYHALNTWIIMVVVVFSLVAVGIPAGALWVRKIAKRDLPRVLMRIPGLNHLMQAIANAPGNLLRKPVLVTVCALLHGSVFLLDAATLWVMLQVVGIQVSFWVTFPSFVLASMVATVGPIPLGLGTFEVTCVSMLKILGIPIEAALTATLLLRGFTLWLPMLPGMWLVKWALR